MTSIYRSQSDIALQRRAWLLRALVFAGFAALAYFLSWLTSSGHITSPWFVIALTLALAYCGLQIAGSWVLYLAASRNDNFLPVPAGLTVDVFVTACHEPVALVARALSAACDMNGAHRTWLLDDGSDPALAELAEALGAGYLTRSNREDAKAGNINSALERTRGDVIVIFDVDHAPEPDFLDRTLGYFSNPRMGFVQVMPTFYNGGDSWVARGAAESSLDFYNPISLGMHRLGSATMMGSNALVRREALLSLGGYQPGLAEDLATSLALHGNGWQSAYVAEPLAPGLAPPDLPAWFTQQLKWARGVFEVLLTQFPFYFRRLTWSQRLAYGVRMTYYWIGPVVAAHMAVALVIALFGDASAQDEFASYLLSLLPVTALFLFIRHVALRTWRHPSIVASLLWRAIVLIYSTWPVYTLAWFMALFRVPLHFHLTPKQSGQGFKLVWLLPQAISILFLTFTVVYRELVIPSSLPITLLAFLLSQIALQFIFISQCVRSRRVELPQPAGGLVISLPTASLTPVASYSLTEASLPDER